MQPVFKILANNDNVTELIKERLIRLSITDEIGFVSDAATIVIDNHDDQVEVPARGAELEVYLGYDVDALVKMGKFMVDEVNFPGRRTKSALRPALLTLLRNVIWEALSVLKADHGMT